MSKIDEEKKKQRHYLEFFITYAWALLVIMAGLGILVYFGLINIEGTSCKVAPQIKCKQLKVEPDRIFLKVKNDMDEMLMGIDVGIDGCNEMDKGNILDKGAEDTYIITGCNNNQPGYRLSTKLNFTYTTQDGKTFTKIGKLTKTVE